MNRRPISFESFQRPLPGLSGHDRLLLFEALPSKVQAEMWHWLAVKVADRHYANGTGPFIERRPKRQPRRPRRTTSTLPSDDWRRGTEALASIPAETYLAVLAPESDPYRGKCRCPLPEPRMPAACPPTARPSLPARRCPTAATASPISTTRCQIGRAHV